MREELYRWKSQAVAEKVANSLKEKMHSAYLVESRDEVIPLIEKLVPKKSKVAYGGSITLNECKVIEYLRNNDFNLLDRDLAKTPEEKNKIFYETFQSDYFFCSANAITYDGKIVQLDGNGTRVAPMIYGPKNIILVVGINKIVKDLNAANDRISYIAPMNAKRLNIKAPCTNFGECLECKSNERICVQRVIIETGVRHPGRYKIILVNENLGL